MAFTPITVTGQFKRPDGSVPSGTVTATLSEEIKNGTVTLDPTPVVGKLDATGNLVNQAGLPFVLEANDDTGTVPLGSVYEFVIQLDNSPVREFNAVVPHAAVGGTIDITALEP